MVGVVETRAVCVWLRSSWPLSREWIMLVGEGAVVDSRGQLGGAAQAKMAVA